MHVRGTEIQQQSMVRDQAGYQMKGCTGPIPSSTVKGTIMSYCHLFQE
jgi:hypothetical protein